MTIQDVQESATLAKIDGNHVNSVAMLSMIDFLASRPSIDEVAQHLVLSVVPHHKPRSAMISLFEHDGSLHAAGSFGLPHSAVNSLQKVSLWDNSPMVDSVRAGNPLVFLSQQSLAHSYPWLEREVALFQPTTAWPLTLRGHRMGALQLIFSDAPSADELASDLTGVVALLSFYLSLNNHESWQSQHEAPLDGQVRQIGGQFTASATRTQLTPAPLELTRSAGQEHSTFPTRWSWAAKAGPARSMSTGAQSPPPPMATSISDGATARELSLKQVERSA